MSGPFSLLTTELARREALARLWSTVLAGLAAGLFGLLLVQTLRLADARQNHAQAVATLQTERAAAATAARMTSERYRLLEKDYRESIDKIAAVGNAGIQRAHDDAGRARAARDSMQRDLADYLTQHRAAAIARAAAGQCTPDTTPIDMLADLQRRADDRAGELAHIADTARARGRSCETAYESARTMIEAARHAQAQ